MSVQLFYIVFISNEHFEVNDSTACAINLCFVYFGSIDARIIVLFRIILTVGTLSTKLKFRREREGGQGRRFSSEAILHWILSHRSGAPAPATTWRPQAPGP